jgi:hypothetical protein
MTRHKVTKSAMALGAKGAILHTAGLDRDANAAFPVASLSKAITAMCLNTLLEQFAFDWDTPLSEITAAWDALDMVPHTQIAKLPLSAFATHTSGLPKNIDADETAGEGRNLYTQIHFARSALRDPAHLNASRKHVYSNVLARSSKACRAKAMATPAMTPPLPPQARRAHRSAGACGPQRDLAVGPSRPATMQGF